MKRTCELCESMDGEEYDVDEAIGIIPGETHPMCFVDHQIPIMTNEGYKEIAKIILEKKYGSIEKIK